MEEEAILESMKPLFEEAESKRLWFYSKRGDMWFSPSELKAKHKEGMYLWRATSWELKDPNEQVQEIELLILNTQKRLADLKIRIIKG